MQKSVSPVTLRAAFRLLMTGGVVLICMGWSYVPGRTYSIVPDEPDYSDSTQWYIKWRDGTADIFYIISTETGDFILNGDTCHHANTYDRSSCPRMLVEMAAVDSFYGGSNNYFSPYYRQVTIQSWLDSLKTFDRLPLALSDVERSWDYYLKHLNHGRPFILAGFSQGAHAMISLLSRMPDSVASRMVAAYVIGYKVTQANLDTISAIRAAQSATDVGVTIVFNSVRAPECALDLVSGGNMLCINPVNWRTDTVRAVFGDTLTARCDPDNHLLLVEGYRQKRLTPIIGREGNYHDRELKFYYPYIRQNMADRVKAFFNRQDSLKHKKCPIECYCCDNVQ